MLPYLLFYPFPKQKRIDKDNSYKKIRKDDEKCLFIVRVETITSLISNCKLFTYLTKKYICCQTNQNRC